MTQDSLSTQRSNKLITMPNPASVNMEENSPKRYPHEAPRKGTLMTPPMMVPKQPTQK